MGEKKVNPIRESVKESIKRRALTKLVGAKRRAPPGTAKRRMADIDEIPQKTEKDSHITEDHCRVKHPPPEEMLLPVVLGLKPAVVIPPSIATEQGKTVTNCHLQRRRTYHCYEWAVNSKNC